MFALEENVIPHFEKICSVDQGYEVNPKVWACKSIVEKLMTAEKGVWGDYIIDVNVRSEAPILRGAQCNLGLSTDDFYLKVCLDLHSLTVSVDGRSALIDYLADITKDYFFYAQSVIEKQKKAAMPRRRKKAD